jgi:hypothetical protein
MSGNARFNPHSNDPILNPPGIPWRDTRDLDAFVDAAERAEKRWMEHMEGLQERISGHELPGDAAQRADTIVNRLHLLWTALWVNRCFLACVYVKTHSQLTRWCDFQLRLMPIARRFRGLNRRNARAVIREGVALVEAAMAAPVDEAAGVWRSFPGWLGTDETPWLATASPFQPDDIPGRAVEAAWRHLRLVAGEEAYPPERTTVTTDAEARSALDEVKNWCRPRAKTQAAGPKAVRQAGSSHDRQAIIMDTLREAIRRKGADGKTAKAADIIRAAHVAQQEGRQALRELQRLGEYDGFTRPAPGRPR